MTEPRRHTADSITDDELDQLYAEREKYGQGWLVADRQLRTAQAALAAEVEVSRTLLKQRQEMAAERYAWQERGDAAEQRAEQAEAAIERVTETAACWERMPSDRHVHIRAAAYAIRYALNPPKENRP